MRKNLAIWIIGVLVWNTSSGQFTDKDESIKALLKFSKKYFRSDPFYGSFSGFLTHLINDPDIDNKVVNKKTDTSLYRFTGVYTQNNPFPFTPKKIEIQLMEIPLEYDDSLHTADTIFLYQLIAYIDNDDKNADALKKEFNKIHRRNSSKFKDNKYLESKKEGQVTFAAYHYFVATTWISPLTIAWGRTEGSNETALIITLRIKMYANETVLPGFAPVSLKLLQKMVPFLQ